MPQAEFLPRLSAEEVDRFVALGKQGQAWRQAGDANRAVVAFRAQLDIFSLNAAPFVSLAVVEAGRGNADAAVGYLQDAVARGFRRLRELQRSEVWQLVDRLNAMLDLEASVVAIERFERDWPAWDAFMAPRVPDDAATITRRQAELVERIDAMAPGLGPRLTRLWKRLIDRAAASMYAGYIAAHAQADDVDSALDSLVTLYAGGPLGRWTVLPADVATELRRTARTLLERSPDGPSRPKALVALALADYVQRDRRGRLEAATLDRIRTVLDEILAEYPDAPVVAVAMAGRIQIELDACDRDRAESLYARFDSPDWPNPAAWADARRQLGGELTLTAGGLPPFQATTLDGDPVDPATLSGRIVVVDFWATWCSPCIEELPTLRRIDKRFGEDVTVLGINMDWSEDLSPSELREWITREQVPGVQVHDGLSWDSEVVRAFGVTEIPFSVVIGADGSVLSVNQHGKELEKAVKTAVRAKPRN